MSTEGGAVKKGHIGEREAWLEKLQFLSNAMETTSQPFATADPGGEIPVFNEAFCRLTGYSREELHALSWTTDLTTADSHLRELEALKVLNRTHTPQRYEKVCIRKDGSTVPIELFTHAAMDSKGRVLFYYAFILDISERKRKEEELRASHDSLEKTVRERTAALSRSEERMRKMMEASPVPMVMFEGNRIIFANRKFTETFGYTINDIPTLDDWWPLAYPNEEYRKFVVRRWDTAIGPAIRDRTDTEPREVVVRCKDGSQKYILSYFSSIGDLNLSVFHDITERKRAEDALRESETMLAKSQEMASIGSWAWDVKTGDISRSAESYRIFGLVPGEYTITFEKFLDFIVPEDREYAASQTKLSLEEDKPYDITYRIRRKDGAIRVLHSRGEPVMDAAGRVVKMYGTNQDVTERKQAEEALQESEVRFRSLIQNSSDIIRILDKEGRIVYDSPSSEKLLGYPPGYTLGKSPFEFIHPDDLKHMTRDLGEVYDARNPGTPTEFRIRKADGEYLDCEAIGANMIGVPGVDGIVVTTRPITERKRAEEARERLLQEVEEQRGRLQATMDSLPVGVVIADASGRIVQMNEMTREIWGDAPLSGDIDGYAEYRGWWANSGEPIKPEAWGLARAVARGETSVGEVIDIQRFDGKRRTILNSAAPVKDARGNFIGGVVTIQDITQRRQMERDLSEAKAQAELYLDLMGHDISNMHQIIMMQLELALDVLDEEGRLEEKDREMLTTSVKTLARSVNLIKNVRTLQKVRSGDYQAEPLDIGHVIEEVVKIYSDIPGRDITINYAPSGGYVVMASPLIKDILGNLVDNAVKHSQDPVEIGIVIGRIRRGGKPFYRVAVEDNGIGIPDEKKDLIFQRFKRGETTAKGTGLGLYIVRTLVEGFGGHVEVEDRIAGDHSKGARFIVYLPTVEAAKHE